MHGSATRNDKGLVLFETSGAKYADQAAHEAVGHVAPLKHRLSIDLEPADVGRDSIDAQRPGHAPTIGIHKLSGGLCTVISGD
jgi:hypothetical protein